MLWEWQKSQTSRRGTFVWILEWGNQQTGGNKTTGDDCRQTQLSPCHHTPKHHKENTTLNLHAEYFLRFKSSLVMESTWTENMNGCYQVDPSSRGTFRYSVTFRRGSRCRNFTPQRKTTNSPSCATSAAMMNMRRRRKYGDEEKGTKCREWPNKNSMPPLILVIWQKIPRWRNTEKCTTNYLDPMFLPLCKKEPWGHIPKAWLQYGIRPSVPCRARENASPCWLWGCVGEGREGGRDGGRGRNIR